MIYILFYSSELGKTQKKIIFFRFNKTIFWSKLTIPSPLSRQKVNIFIASIMVKTKKNHKVMSSGEKNVYIVFFTFSIRVMYVNSFYCKEM